MTRMYMPLCKHLTNYVCSGVYEKRVYNISLKGPFNQIRSAWKWYGQIGLGGDPGFKKIS